ncbi:MAG: hypothetical protein JRN53_01945 [Nitrososphaerota archaeon]|jgi:hypothetical protein|nr:hypothetical protein [Nitrososphaerota archaeon]MDG7046332.1 hypothetical protein [Nitrososphaerota archaeon]MDG7048080.1 hypothetical protein [Nitrososphaerota archaeon]
MESSLGNKVRLKVGLTNSLPDNQMAYSVIVLFPELIDAIKKAQSQEFIKGFEDVLQSRPEPSVVSMDKPSFIKLYNRLKMVEADLEDGPVIFRYNGQSFSLTMDAICG